MCLSAERVTNWLPLGRMLSSHFHCCCCCCSPSYCCCCFWSWCWLCRCDSKWQFRASELQHWFQQLHCPLVFYNFFWLTTYNINSSQFYVELILIKFNSAKNSVENNPVSIDCAICAFQKISFAYLFNIIIFYLTTILVLINFDLQKY